MGNLSIREADPAKCRAAVILCDLSGSMKGQPFQRLREHLSMMWQELEGSTSLFGFNDRCFPVERPEKLPDPQMGTRLTEAFNHVAQFWPAEVILISDGLPEDQQGALDAASRLPGVINAIFVGPDSDRIGYEFMQKLAQANGGQAVHRDLHTAQSLIAPAIRSMLALPSPIAL